MLDLLTAIGVRRRSLLVIPNCHGHSPIDRHEDFCAWLRYRQREGTRSSFMASNISGSARRTAHAIASRIAGSPGAKANSSRSTTRMRGMLTGAGLDAEGFVAPAWLINAMA